MCDFHQLLTGISAPYWITCECPKCKDALSFRSLCDHGDLFTCSTCGFEDFAPYNPWEDGLCDQCAQWWAE